VDNVDVAHATAHHVAVLIAPGMGHMTVAEHAIGLMWALSRQFWPIVRSTKSGEWQRIIGHELYGKTLAVLGVGRIGRALVQRARAFEMRMVGFDNRWDGTFAAAHELRRASSVQEAVADADVVSLHMNLDAQNRGLINADLIGRMKRGALLVNTARGGLVVEEDVARACRSGQLGGYAADVLEREPPGADHPFAGIDNILITPHVASRTHESVQRLAMRAVLNLVNYLSGRDDYIQVNAFAHVNVTKAQEP
jgi:D-3-phosphoglycerate dehydrogenase